MEYGILGLLVLILDVVAVIKILGSGASTGAKALWVLGILIFPLIGFIVWLLAGPRSSGRLA
ncbi:PLD nuclease N-terminal domain-containing protein [Roseibium sediminicola]|uniref:PLD nuclease N-terminal domain-containing protein n=1 Tax=Roseibium sediminicola TaxID=2933272 RepID=A0ABT0H084_9HYPH|nr:PLD nuclease N-terminal domain-containing protein [Roseibium sp. CAU 1639]MCK7615096.1 PLD nuclease N-terminal domain-containing protein [Roseibium sp. CAU 1639]